MRATKQNLAKIMHLWHITTHARSDSPPKSSFFAHAFRRQTRMQRTQNRHPTFEHHKNAKLCTKTPNQKVVPIVDPEKHKVATTQAYRKPKIKNTKGLVLDYSFMWSICFRSANATFSILSIRKVDYCPSSPVGEATIKWTYLEVNQFRCP